MYCEKLHIDQTHLCNYFREHELILKNWTEARLWSWVIEALPESIQGLFVRLCPDSLISADRDDASQTHYRQRNPDGAVDKSLYRLLLTNQWRYRTNKSIQVSVILWKYECGFFLHNQQIQFLYLQFCVTDEMQCAKNYICLINA